MQTPTLLRTCGSTLAAGALACAAAITAEAVTDPNDVDRAPHYDAALAAPVALLLFAGLLALLVGLAGLAVALQSARGRGTLWVALIGLGLAVAEIPHTIIDMAAAPALYDQLPHAVADGLINDHIDALPGALSGVGIVFLLVGSIGLAVALWRGAVLARWAPGWAIACLALAIAELPLSDVAWWLPHGPVLLYVGLAGYGVALATSRRMAASWNPTGVIDALTSK